MASRDIDKRILLVLAIGLGIFSFVTSLAYHNIADGDLWARLAQGASIWNRGSLIHKDVFAFTPVLPEYIDYEWGAGLIFFSLLKIFGPESLLALKIISAVAALACAIAVGRLNKSDWPVLLLLALLSAAAIISGYVLVVRSQVLTYLFFSIMLFCLEAIRRGHRWPPFVIIALMLSWANIHGGFAAGLGIIAIYTVSAFASKKMFKIMSVTMAASTCVTFINPYGLKLWKYLIPALLHSRAYITEWHPMSMSFSRIDPYTGFRILFIAAMFVIAVGWNRVDWRKNLPGLLILLITAYLALRHRWHAPFFGLSSAAFLGPYLAAAIERATLRMPANKKIAFGNNLDVQFSQWYRLESIYTFLYHKKISPMMGIVVIYGIAALLIANYILPGTTFKVWSPFWFYPVRECDVLKYSNAEGNLVVPFPWGNYCMWRLYPRVKISQCGRYETIYPESTIDMNRAFFHKLGDEWDHIVREYKVDYVILELHSTQLRAEDLEGINFKPVYSDGYSALWAREELAPSLREAAHEVQQKETIEPLDARIPCNWWQ